MKNRILFYPRLAFSNMKKNAGIYLPYLLAGILLSALYYMVQAVGTMAVDSGMKGAAEMAFILQMCGGLFIVIMFLILFYLNSFVMKRRKRELGLYCILGMEKRHLCVLLFWEVLLSAVTVMIGGVLSGALFSQFMFLVMLKLIKVPALLTFTVPLSAAGATFAVFSAGYFVVLVYDWIAICKTKPVELLKSRQEGEREPKTRWLTALIGVLTLAGGYGIAIRVNSPSMGILAFFPAALLVIIGTYCLFLSGSIVLLKFLRNRKRFYYRPENFIAVSGMLYRMKQNAAGLSTIAVLSTALLVVLSSSVTLYAGEEGKLSKMFTREYRLWARPDAVNDEASCAAASSAAQSFREQVDGVLKQRELENRVSRMDGYDFFYSGWMAKKQGNRFEEAVLKGADADLKQICSIVLITLEDYNNMTGSQETLSEGEVLYMAPGPGDIKSVTIGEEEMQVKKRIERPEELLNLVLNQDIYPFYCLVVPDLSELLRLCRVQKSPQLVEYYNVFDLEGTDGDVQSFVESITADTPAAQPARFESKSDYRDQFYLLYGSILFIGILFSALFLIATVLIIYYKQVTEGYDDRERFQIMEKVGMRQSEIRAAIQKQVLIVFFLPLVTSVVHICVATGVLRLLLAILGLTDVRLFWLCILASCLVFAAVYFIVYQLTARVYYRIVHAKAAGRP